MTVQSTYADNISAAKVGMLANSGLADIISRTLEDATLSFGLAVTKGSDDNGCALLDQGEEFLGVGLRERTVDPDNPDNYVQYDSVQVLRKGVVWVTAGVAVSDGDSVYYETGDDTWSNTASSNTVAVSDARWESTAAAGALAKLRLR